jgi:uncharacterized NAD(P)/FAD-binding protein YdhS
VEKHGDSWTKLTNEQELSIAEMVVEELSGSFNQSKVNSLVHSMLDSIAGFETVSESRRRSTIQRIWRRAVFLRRAEKVEESVSAQVNAFTQAVSDGKVLIESGKSKREAAMAIYSILQDKGKEDVIKAFIEGASLTEKGAITYWYYCRRKVGKDNTE